MGGPVFGTGKRMGSTVCFPFCFPEIDREVVNQRVYIGVARNKGDLENS
jgi:hypothetical protein